MPCSVHEIIYVHFKAIINCQHLQLPSIKRKNWHNLLMVTRLMLKLD